MIVSTRSWVATSRQIRSFSQIDRETNEEMFRHPPSLVCLVCSYCIDNVPPQSALSHLISPPQNGWAYPNPTHCVMRSAGLEKSLYWSECTDQSRQWETLSLLRESAEPHTSHLTPDTSPQSLFTFHGPDMYWVDRAAAAQSFTHWNCSRSSGPELYLVRAALK